jgi:hypothetical protein
MPEFCRGCQADVLRFTTGTSVWPADNISERGVRPLKTQQKVSGRLTIDDVTQDRLGIRSYIDTARKHGLSAWEVLHQLMPGHPWLPRHSQSPRSPSRNRATITPGHPSDECSVLPAARGRVSPQILRDARAMEDATSGTVTADIPVRMASHGQAAENPSSVTSRIARIP